MPVFQRLAALIHRRPGWILAVACVIIVICAAGLTRLQLATGYNTFINESSKTFTTNDRFQRSFGGDSIFVMTTGDRNAVLSPSGMAAQRAAAAEALANPYVRQVISPAAVVDIEVRNMAAQKLALQAARSQVEQQSIAKVKQAMAKAPAKVLSAASARARQQADAAFLANLRKSQPRALALLSLNPLSASNPRVIAAILGTGPKPADPTLAALFPDLNHTVTEVQLQGNLDLSPQRDADAAVKAAYEHHPIPGQTLTISGIPVLFGDLVPVLLDNLFLLFGVAFVIMGAVLLLVFNVRWRLLPLGVVLGSVVLTFGLMGWIQLNLTIATTASLPILLGLGVDYMVQIHNRYEEETTKGQGIDVLLVALSQIGPAVGIAVVATILGFLTLLISPVPMVRDFAKVLAGGVLLSYIASIFVLTSILVLRDKRRARATRRLHAAQRHVVDRFLAWLSSVVIPRPLPILAIAVLVAVAGWAADSHISTQTDIERLVPQQMPALKQIQEIRAVNGGTTELDVMVTAPDVTSPAVLQWMKAYENSALASHGIIISANSPVTLLAALAGDQQPSAANVKKMLANSPAVLRGRVLTTDLQHATIIFTIQQRPMDVQVKLIDQLQAAANPPAGVIAELTGTAVVAARTVSVLSDNRLQITLLGVGVVFVGLLILYRRPSRALLVVFPMILVIGWSSGAMYVLGEPWNPLTVTLGALIIGIGAEFTILLMERYTEESAAGREPAAAMDMAMRRIGRAITTSGLMVMAGFSALIASDFPALRVFGIVVAADMAGILIATLVVLPPLVVAVEHWRARRAGG